MPKIVPHVFLIEGDADGLWVKFVIVSIYSRARFRDIIDYDFIMSEITDLGRAEDPTERLLCSETP